MKVVIQRVKSASCYIKGELISSIEHGMMILVSFTHSDTIDNVDKMAKKVVNLRIFSDEAGKMNLDINKVSGSILSISQFTLYGNCEKGNRPSFIDSMEANAANQLYELFNQTLLEQYHINTQVGVFGADMELAIKCDGPVTIEMEN